MNSLLLAASLLLCTIGLVHSVLGERLVFRRLRRGTIVPAHGGDVLLERHVRILWATWHAVTVMAWGLGLVLLQVARSPEGDGTHAGMLWAIALATLGASLLVLVGTRARHPGWLGLLVAAVLVWLGLPG